MPREYAPHHDGRRSARGPVGCQIPKGTFHILRRRWESLAAFVAYREREFRLRTAGQTRSGWPTGSDQPVHLLRRPADDGAERLQRSPTTAGKAPQQIASLPFPNLPLFKLFGPESGQQYYVPALPSQLKPKIGQQGCRSTCGRNKV